MEFFKILETRFSVRSFKDEHLNKEEIEKILKAGHIAPTGCNNKPQKILVLNTDESIEKLRNCTKSHFGAPTAMLVCYDKTETWTRRYDGATSAPVDAAIVTTHMMLAAHDIGVGACWVMNFNPDEMRKTFKIPNSYEPLALLVMGYPNDDAKPSDFHFKVRPIEENIFYESF